MNLKQRLQAAWRALKGDPPRTTIKLPMDEIREELAWHLLHNGNGYEEQAKRAAQHFRDNPDVHWMEGTAWVFLRDEEYVHVVRSIGTETTLPLTEARTLD